MHADAPIKLVHVSGSHRNMGRQIGETCVPAIEQMVENYKKLLQASYDELYLTWDDAVLQARKYYPYALEYTPLYVEEMQGMAEGAGVNFDDLLVLNCMEGVMVDALHLRFKCTSLAVGAEHTRNGHVLVGHNEDWIPIDEDTVYLVHATPEDEPPFLAMTYGGMLPNVGFNAAGIAQCCDSVYPQDLRVGVPRVCVARAALGAPRLSIAMRKAIMNWRAAGYNHLFADRNGELYNVEASAHRFATLYGHDGYLVHTNHYLTSTMQAIEDKPEDLLISHVRYNRASRLLHNLGPHTVETLEAILSDHMNHPDSICRHVSPEDTTFGQSKTVASMIMDLTTFEMHIAWGSPCEATFHTFRLEV